MAPMQCKDSDVRYRLSKPKTRGVPSPGESRVDLNASFTRESSPMSTEYTDTTKSRYSARIDVKESLNGGNTRRKDLESEADDEVDNSRRKRVSRSNPVVGKRASMRYSFGLSRSSTTDTSHYSVESAGEEDISETIKRKVMKDKLAALNQSQEMVHDNEEDRRRIISPIRRRSFFTPGLATRDPVNPLARPPTPCKKQDSESEYYYNPSLSVSSPLERIAALDLANRPITPMTRAGTPGDLDYGRIGRLQITNGMASPVPSTRSGVRKVSAGQRNSANYFNLPQSTSPLAQTSQTYKQDVHRDSDLDHNTMIQDYHDTEFEKELRYTTASESPALWSSIESDTGTVRRRTKSHGAIPRRDRASLLASDYMIDLADNPFELGHDNDSFLTMSFGITAKPNEMDDELFDEQALRRESSRESLLHHKLLLPAIEPIGDDFERQTAGLLASVGRSYSTLDMSAMGQNDRISNCKNDSGYSSSTSTKSYRQSCGYHGDSTTVEVSKTRSSTGPDDSNTQTTMKARRRPTPVTIPTSTTFQGSIFSKSTQSSDTIPTIATTGSAIRSTSNVSTPRKLKKPRPQSQPPPSNRVSIQMHPDIDPGTIPSVSAELTYRMARRAAELPPLTYTMPSVDRLRREEADFKQAPLSAPLRFPSPQPTVDRIWDQVMGVDHRRPKPVRNRHSFMGVLQSNKSTCKPDSNSRANLTSLGDVHGILGRSPYEIASPRGFAQQKLPDSAPQIRPTMPRARSMIGMTDHEAAELSRMRSMHRVSSARQMKEASDMRKSSSVYTGDSQWTDATPEPYTERSSSVDTANTMLPSLAYGDFAPTGTRHGLRKSSSERQFNDMLVRPGKLSRVRSEPKDLPPLPTIPAATQVGMRESKVKNNENTKKSLPPLPHQRKTSSDTVLRGLSPCRESGYWSEKVDKKNQSGSKIPESDIRQTKHKHNTSLDRQTSPSRAMQAPSPRRQPTLPNVSDARHESEKATRSRTTNAASPRRTQRWQESHSPERMQPNWRPPRPTAKHVNTEWPRSERSPSPQRQFDREIQPNYGSTVPQGLVARMSGRFEGGLSYNYDPIYGIAGSAGTNNGYLGIRKSVDVSRGYGIDLTDIPVFIAKH